MILLAEPMKYNMDTVKILFTINQMKSRYAEEWVNSVMEQFTALRAEILAWDIFKAWMDVEFMDAIEKENAYLVLMKL